MRDYDDGFEAEWRWPRLRLEGGPLHVLPCFQVKHLLRRKRCDGEACVPRDGLLARSAYAIPGLARHREMPSGDIRSTGAGRGAWCAGSALGGRAVGAAVNSGVITSVCRYNAARCRAPAP